ncbi:ATPase [Kitasatospora sp. NPDC057692]|uniref:RapZ C-terminal domain-containing protein n=1 Tax=Kitasatospora sp. NPDC057692 TaxID=3346215 RepID=UPI00369DEA5F
MRPTIRIVSFGTGHGEPPHLDLPAIDMRPYRDPHIDPAMREMTGRDQAVIDRVLATPGADERINTAVVDIAAYASGPGRHQTTITAGTSCTGGRHRSVVACEQAAERLRRRGWTVTTEHRDIDKPVIQR